MQGTKIVVWVLAVALAATALMFGVASLMRASDGEVRVSSRRSANPAASVLSGISIDSDIVRRRYVRLCNRNQWDNVGDMLDFSQQLMAYLTINKDMVTPVTRAMLGQQVSMAGVSLGKSWPELRVDWGNDDLRDLHPPTRKELAETTRYCIRNLTDAARRWNAVVNVW